MNTRFRDLWDRALSFGMITFVLAWTVVGGPVAAMLVARLVSETYVSHVTSKDWPSTHATVVEASMAQDCGGGRAGSRYSLHVVYAYEVGQQRFRNDRIWFGNALCSDRSEVQSRLNRFPPGARLFVHYDPQEPSRSVVYRGGVENGTVILIVVLSSMSLGWLWWLSKLFREFKSDWKRKQDRAKETPVYKPRMHDVPIRRKVER